MTTTPTRLEAIVIGAGFSGLYALHRLRELVGSTAGIRNIVAGVTGSRRLDTPASSSASR